MPHQKMNRKRKYSFISIQVLSH